MSRSIEVIRVERGFRLKVNGRTAGKVYPCRMSAHHAMCKVIRSAGMLDTVTEHCGWDLAAEAIEHILEEQHANG